MTTLLDKYKNDGYVIVPNLIKDDLINSILNELSNFKSKNSLYFSQSEHNWRKVKNDIDDYGLLNCSFENFTNLIWANDLSKYGLSPGSFLFKL